MGYLQPRLQQDHLLVKKEVPNKFGMEKSATHIHLWRIPLNYAENALPIFTTFGDWQLQIWPNCKTVMSNAIVTFCKTVEPNCLVVLTLIIGLLLD